MHEHSSGRRGHRPARVGKLAAAMGACLCAGQLLASTPALAIGAAGTPSVADGVPATGGPSPTGDRPPVGGQAGTAMHPLMPAGPTGRGRSAAAGGSGVPAGRVAPAAHYLQVRYATVRQPGTGDRSSAVDGRSTRRHHRPSFRLRHRPSETQRHPASLEAAASQAPPAPRVRGSRELGGQARRSQVVRAAARLSGRPYGWGAAGPWAFDCSGFTQYVYRNFGHRLPHSAHEQQWVGRPVSRAAARPGDLVFIRSGGYAYHVGIYAGGGYFYDAPRSGQTVGRHRIWDTWLARRLIG